MKRAYPFALLLALSAAFSGCSVAGGIFKGGIYIGAIGVILVVVLIIWLITRGRR